MLKGPWDDIPEAFLSSKILDLCSTLVLELSDELVQQLSLLSWVTPFEVREYFTNLKDRYEQQLKCEMEKERWKSHSLYRNKTKTELERMCRKLRIPVTSALLKHQLVSLIALKNGEQLPDDSYASYSGKLDEIPTSTSKISNSLTLPFLRSILKFHNLPVSGTKDQLVMRMYLLRHNKTAAVTTREEKQMLDLISLIYKAILEQRRLNVTAHIYIDNGSTHYRKQIHTLYGNRHMLIKKKTSQTYLIL